MHSFLGGQLPSSRCHRDIKLDNTLLDGQLPPTVKLCDFQFSKYWGRPQLTRMKTHLGTAVSDGPDPCLRNNCSLVQL